LTHRIDSLSDDRIADYAHVADSAWLLDRGLFVAEGRLVVRRLLEADRFLVQSVLVTPAAVAALGAVLSADRYRDRLPVYVCEQAVLNEIAGFNFHRGCLALAKRPLDAVPLDRLAGSHRLLALESIGNPDNVGGLFRVAAAFAAGGVILDQRSGDPLYRKAIRTSMGAALRVPFIKSQSWLDDLRWLQRNGITLVALTPDKSATTLQAFAGALDPAQPLVLMLGAEEPGLTAAAREAADARVRIPISPDMDSLNVVVAAGIALATVQPASEDLSRAPRPPQAS
jgi:tRNA G18 (ribose-2'-O)-methylase SpoU